MARTGHKDVRRSRKSREADLPPQAIRSQALRKASADESRRSANADAARNPSVRSSGTSAGEVEDWLAAKKDFDRQLKRL
ncbi:MAG TPA: hypothetical protein VK130_10265 [Steroidobacteraceae bacterium]|nr:hypothetical protein [Steroidobacteraceae bacterium]